MRTNVLMLLPMLVLSMFLLVDLVYVIDLNKVLLSQQVLAERRDTKLLKQIETILHEKGVSGKKYTLCNAVPEGLQEPMENMQAENATRHEPSCLSSAFANMCSFIASRRKQSNDFGETSAHNSPEGHICWYLDFVTVMLLQGTNTVTTSR